MLILNYKNDKALNIINRLFKEIWDTAYTRAITIKDII